MDQLALRVSTAFCLSGTHSLIFPCTNPAIDGELMGITRCRGQYTEGPPGVSGLQSSFGGQYDPAHPPPTPGSKMTEANNRKSEYPIDAMFLDRWSPRAFTGEIIAEEQLLTILDAAHWAPSSGNQQPWRFIYALKGTDHFAKHLSLLVESNQEWAKNASALIFVISRGFSGDFSENKQRYTHSFDAGAAWGHLAMQARFSGFYAHGMAGIKLDEIKQAFAIPEGYRVEAGVAIGRLGDKSVLSERNQAREVPSQRMPLAEVAFNGKFIAN
jgi:nitroreductase